MVGVWFVCRLAATTPSILRNSKPIVNLNTRRFALSSLYNYINTTKSVGYWADSWAIECNILNSVKLHWVWWQDVIRVISMKIDDRPYFICMKCNTQIKEFHEIHFLDKKMDWQAGRCNESNWKFSLMKIDKINEYYDESRDSNENKIDFNCIIRLNAIDHSPSSLLRN